MSSEQSFSGLKALKKKMEEEKKQTYEENSKKRLSKIIETKLKTSFIGALSHFEENVGLLWGHGADSELTEEQEFMKEVWEKTRTSVLNNGNNQIRACKFEIDQYQIHWNRYQMKLPVKPLPEKKEEPNG